MDKHKEIEELNFEKILFRSLMDHISDLVYFKDLDGKFIRVNKAEAQLLGLEDSSEALGKSDVDFFKHFEERMQEEQEVIKTGKPLLNHMRTYTINGETHFMCDSKDAVLDDEGHCIGTVGITRDMTSLIGAEKALKESQSKFKALFDNAPLAIFRLDENRTVVESNHRFRKMFGYSDEQLNIDNILVDPEISMLIFDTVLETKEVTTEIMLKRKNGESFIANMTLALLEEGFKGVTIEGIIDDITQMVKARDEIIKAKDIAIEANRIQTLFLANMSHEVRTPMNAIIGFTNMLREPSISREEMDSFIDVVQSNGQSLMMIIDSIIDFSKIEAGQMGISKSEFNLTPLIDTISEEARKSIEANFKGNIQLIKKVPEIPSRLYTDRHRLSQVLNYLISNAVKFTDNGEIEIGYYADGEDVNIYVRDTGIGIAKANHKKIFERFAKINEDKNRLYGGTGIGLTISKGLIELMGGSIEVESELGQGAKFTIKLSSELPCS